MHYLTVEEVMSDYLTGDGDGWFGEFKYLREEHANKIRALTRDVLMHGMKEPILLGDDGRVWDGHNRIYVAYHMGFESIPVKYARNA